MNLITNNISTLKIHKMTQAQYERELAAGNIDENALYLTPDEARDLSLYLTKDEATQEYESQISAQEKLSEAKEYAETVILAVTKEMGESKADKEHNHDEMYYTEDEVDELLANKKGNDIVVTVSGDETSGYIADKTYAEITQAYNDGKTCILIDVDGSILTLTSLSKLYASFALLGSYSSRVVLVTAANKVIIKTTQFVKDEENPSLATSNKTIIGAINELDTGLDNHKHSIEDIEGFNSSVDSAILYTEQELTDEQRAQARQNIAKMQYDWREVPCAGLGAVHKIADASMYYGTSPTLDIDGAISLTSVSSAKYSAIGYLHGAVEFLLMSTDIGTQISLFMPRILSEYNLICNSGLLNGNYLYMCQESDTSDEIELLYVMSPNNTNGFTHSITIAKCSNYVGEGRIYYNEATGDYQIAMSARKHTDDTLTLVDYPADAKAVGDTLATKITAPATATVGQTIVVKSVDENGKPTEWEAVDMASGGTAVTVTNVSESTADGGSNVVTFSDGKTLTIKNGSKGSPGTPGKDGVDGQDGKDYVLTASDKTEIAEMVEGATIVQAPKYVNTVEEMTDTNRPYVLISTGHIWANAETTVETEGTVTDNITATDDNPYVDGSRLGSSGDVMNNDAAGYHITPLIDLTKAKYQGKRIQIHLEGAQYASTGAYAAYIQCRAYGTDKAVLMQRPYTVDANIGGSGLIDVTNGTISVEYKSATSAVITIDVPPTYGSGKVAIGYIRFCGKGSIADSKISITYTDKITTTGVQWFDTNTSYAPTLTAEDKAEIAEDVAEMIDTQLLAIIGDGSVTV